MVSTESTRGIRIPWQHNPESLSLKRNRISRAIQPVSNAYEDAAQIIGGRTTHGDNSGRGCPRKARPPATRDSPVPAEVSPISADPQSNQCENGIAPKPKCRQKILVFSREAPL